MEATAAAGLLRQGRRSIGLKSISRMRSVFDTVNLKVYADKSDAEKYGEIRKYSRRSRFSTGMEKAFLYEYRDVTLDRLSEYLGLSGRQTERFLKEYYGKTFAQKRTDARMSAACVFLKEDAPDLYDIAEKTGYRSIDYFIKAFKNYFQITPKRYIQLYRESGGAAHEYQRNFFGGGGGGKNWGICTVYMASGPHQTDGISGVEGDNPPAGSRL